MGEHDKIGRYIKEGFLNCTPSSRLFIVRDPQNNDLLVAKVIGEVKNEIEIHRMLEHKNIVKLIDIVQLIGETALILEKADCELIR